MPRCSSTSRTARDPPPPVTQAVVVHGAGDPGGALLMAGPELVPGIELGPSSWIEVTQERIDRFAEATEDFQWIHVDPERAAAGPFGGTIAHGYLTLALVPVMAGEVVPRPDARMSVNYGLNRVRFPAPVPAGSRVRGRFRVDGVETFDWGRQVTMTVTIEREDGDKPVCIAETVSRSYS